MHILLQLPTATATATASIIGRGGVMVGSGGNGRVRGVVAPDWVSLEDGEDHIGTFAHRARRCHLRPSFVAEVIRWFKWVTPQVEKRRRRSERAIEANRSCWWRRRWTHHSLSHAGRCGVHLSSDRRRGWLRRSGSPSIFAFSRHRRMRSRLRTPLRRLRFVVSLDGSGYLWFFCNPSQLL